MDLQRLIDTAPDGATVEIPVGRWEANLRIERALTLVGAADGEVLIDGGGRGPVIEVRARGAEVVIARLTLVNGAASEGGGIVLRRAKALRIEDCVFEHNRAPLFGGGALYLAEGEVFLLDCLLLENSGQQGGAVLVDGTAEVLLEQCTVIGNEAVLGGAFAVREAGQLHALACTIGENHAEKGHVLFTGATMTRTPRARFTASTLRSEDDAQAIANNPELPAIVEIVA
jgi:hypothetical protein